MGVMLGNERVRRRCLVFSFTKWPLVKSTLCVMAHLAWLHCLEQRVAHVPPAPLVAFQPHRGIRGWARTVWFINRASEISNIVAPRFQITAKILGRESQPGPAGKDECVQGELDIGSLRALNYHYYHITWILKHLLNTSFAYPRGFLVFCCHLFFFILQWFHLMQSQKRDLTAYLSMFLLPTLHSHMPLFTTMFLIIHVCL